MAFRILTDDEKVFLTEKELKKYEIQLKEYNDRVAFVEKLEKLENVELKPYKAKRPVIKDISNVKISDISAKNAVSKAPEIKIEKKNYSAPDVKQSEIPNAEICNIPELNIQSASIKSMDMPPSVLSAIPKLDIKSAEVKSVEIPSSALENIPDINIVNTENQLKISMPVADIEVVDLKIPTEYPEYKFEFSEVNVDNISTKDTIVPSFEKLSIPKANASVPENSELSEIPVVEFKKPEAQINNMPDINMPDMNISKINMPDKVSVNAINTNDVKIPDKTVFKKPDMNVKASAPAVPVAEKININMPEPKISIK